jgi:hypothetical protein
VPAAKATYAPPAARQQTYAEASSRPEHIYIATLMQEINMAVASSMQ